MYRVVIIDDEDRIVEGLKQVLDWGRYGCEVVGSASDAKSGAQVIRARRPEILFTDIKMPDMDGLTMLAGLRAEFPEMQIAVLTGYRDFDYAKRAIQLGVTRYLLKPSRMSELQEALEAMTENLKKLRPSAPQPGDAEALPGESSANSFIVKSAMRYIELHYAEKLTLTEVADQTYVSQWYLSKLLNKYMNAGFSELLNRTRIKKAKELLKDPSLRIHEISDLLGFNDVTHFSRIFKKLEQVSPAEYRNRLSIG